MRYEKQVEYILVRAQNGLHVIVRDIVMKHSYRW